MGKPPPSQEDEDPTPYLFVSLEQKRIDQSKPYDSKKACWIPDDKEGYIMGEIKATKGDIVSVGIAGGEVKNENENNHQFSIILHFYHIITHIHTYTNIINYKTKIYPLSLSLDAQR